MKQYWHISGLIISTWILKHKQVTGLSIQLTWLFLQEVSPIAISAETKIESPRSKKRKIVPKEDESEGVIVHPNKEPEKFPDYKAVIESSITSDVARYVFWILIPGLNAADQTISSYSGWCTQGRIQPKIWLMLKDSEFVWTTRFLIMGNAFFYQGKRPYNIFCRKLIAIIYELH